MSISPPTDIVLDVARAADPVRLSEAAAKLNRARPGDAAAFAKVLGDVDDTSTVAGATPPSPSVNGPAPEKRPTAASAFQNFEAMTLATMIESAMPDDGTGVYGTGTAGSVWKSMMAEQLGIQMAKAGGIGLASQLERSGAAALLGSGDTSSAGAGERARSLIIDNVERSALEDIRPGAQNDTDIGSLFQDNV